MRTLIVAAMSVLISSTAVADMRLLERIEHLGKVGLSRSCSEAYALKGSANSSWTVLFTPQPTSDEEHGRRPGDLNITYSPGKDIVQIMESHGCNFSTGVCLFKTILLDSRTGVLRSGASYVSMGATPLRQPDGFGRYFTGEYYGMEHKKLWETAAVTWVARAEAMIKKCG